MGESPANIIGAIVGGAVGAVLGALLAKELGLKGAKRAALIAAATIGGAVLGAFLGPYIAKLGSKVISAAKTAGKKVAKAAGKAASKATPKAYCFVAGTKVLTSTGKTPIEKVKPGDWVYAENPETGEFALKQVIQTFVSETRAIVSVIINGEEILTTPGHLFYIIEKGWIGADELTLGDQVLLSNQECATVESVSLGYLEEPIAVYNFEVEDYHTYFVGNQSILVHNKCGMNNLRTLKERVIKGYKVSMDLERGGSGMPNIHLKVGSTKYYYNFKLGKFFTSAGKELPKVLRNNDKIIAALEKALSMINKGW